MTKANHSEPLSIGKLASATGASVRSIRHYDEHGLLKSLRASNGYRVFQPAAVTQVKQIQRMIASGFRLAEIRSFPDCMLIGCEREVEQPLPTATTAIGIDVGIARFATMSDARFIAPLNSFKRHQLRLARYQRRSTAPCRRAIRRRGASTAQPV